MSFSAVISVVQHASNKANFNFGGSHYGTVAAGFANPVGYGNSIIACIGIAQFGGGGVSINTLNDNNGKFFSQIATAADPTQLSAVSISQNVTSGASVVSLTAFFGVGVTHNSGAVATIDIYEVSGLARVGTITDTFTNSDALGSTWTSGGIATIVPNEIWFGVVASYPAQGTTDSIIGPGAGFVNSPQLDGVTWLNNVDNQHFYSTSGYNIVNSTGTLRYIGTFGSGGSHLYAVAAAAFMASPSSSDSFANQGESTFITANLSASDSAVNQGETNTVQATLSSSDSFSNQGETTYLIETFPSSDSFANQGETNLVLQIITDTDSFANQGETSLALIGIQDLAESAHFMEMSNLTEFPSPPPGFLTTFFPGVLHPVTSPIYMGRARKSAVLPSMWKTMLRNGNTKTSNFNVVSARKNSTKAVAWNTLHRVEVIRVGAFNGLPRPIVSPIDWSYKIDQVAWRAEVRKSASVSTSWRTTQRKTGLVVKKTAWNALVKNSVQQAFQFRALVRVSVPESASAGNPSLVRPVVYPIIPTYLGSGVQIAWKLNSRLVPSQRSSWMVRIPVKAQKKTAFNDNGILVSSTKQSTWMLKKKVTASQASAFRDVTRTFNRKPTSWMTRVRSSSQKIIRFNVHGKVSATTVMQWKMVAHVVARSRSTFNDRLAVKPQARTTWMTRYRWYATPIPPPQVVYAGKVVDQVVHPLGSMRGFAPNKAIQWRVPIYHVVAQSPTGNAGVTSIEWNARKRLSASKKIAWNTVGRINVKQITVYNVLIPAKSQAVIQWNVGNVLVQRIHTSAQSREDFAY